jgi:hypothetical protein
MPTEAFKEATVGANAEMNAPAPVDDSMSRTTAVRQQHHFCRHARLKLNVTAFHIRHGHLI